MPQVTRCARMLFLLVLFAMMLSACGKANEDATFNPDSGRHPDDWADPLSIGRDDFHSTLITEIQSGSRGVVLFNTRCKICHGDDASGKIGPDIRAADLTLITSAIQVISLMKGQSDLSQGDLQLIADYLAFLNAGGGPAAHMHNTESCERCHGSDLGGGIAQISCFSCHDGPEGDIGHPAGWAAGTDGTVNFHGTYGRRFNVACTNCHGVNFDGALGPACASCHDGVTATVLDFVPVPTATAGQVITISVSLSGDSEVPPVVTTGAGTAVINVNINTREISGSVTFAGLTGNSTLAHIHEAPAGANGPVVIPLSGGAGATSGVWTIPLTRLTLDQFNTLANNGFYINIHSATNPAGEIRGQIIFTGTTVTTSLTGDQSVPPVVTTGTGTGILLVNTSTREISGTVSFSGLTGNATLAHIHEGAAGVNGPVAVALTGGAGATSGVWTIPSTILTVEQFNAFLADGLYFAIHTATNPAGEIRGQIIYNGTTRTALLTGSQTVPPVATPGTGTGVITVNLITRAVSGNIVFSGLTGNATAAHIHQGTAGVNGPVIITMTGGAGATSGVWTIPAGTILTVDQLNAFQANGLYFAVHSATNLGGEIRGQIIF
ncbi:MAG: CHRD domain-containing protein [Nitrospirae bacterium]|nr:CHRD domain-containing protein [Nitrospirota bacterium]